MNSTQVQTALAPIIAAVAGFLAAKFPLLDQATWNMLIGTIAVTATTLYIAFTTRKTGLADSLGKYQDTTVVTDKTTANSLPKNDSVVSNDDVKVVKK